MTTVGVSPKLIAAVVAAVVTHLLTQTVLDLPPVAVLGLQVVAIVVSVYSASPGSVLPVGGVGVGPDPQDALATGEWSPSNPDVNVAGSLIERNADFIDGEVKDTE